MSEFTDIDTNDADDLTFDLEYLYNLFELHRNEKEGITHWLALMYFMQGEWRLDACQRLLRFIKGIQLSPEAIGEVYRVAGSLYQQQGKWDALDTAYKHAIAIFHETNQPIEEANALNNYALALQEQQLYKQATEQYQQALALYGTLDTIAQGQVNANLGGMAYERGHWHEAIEFYLRAIPLLKQTENKSVLASFYNNLGVAYENAGELETAEQQYLHCVDLLDEAKESYSERGVRILNNLGQLYSKRDLLDKAISCFEWAVTICEEMDDISSTISTQNNLGAVYIEQSHYEKAVSCFHRSAELAQKIGDHHTEIVSLNNMGSAYTNLDEWELAEGCYQSSVMLSQERKDRYGEARGYNNLGALMAHHDQREEAIRYYDRAATIAHSIGHFHRETTILTNIASQYAQLHQSEKSASYFDRAWSLAEEHHYYDGLAALCTLQGDTALFYQELYPVAYQWFIEACRYAIQDSPHTVQQITEHITIHLQRLQQRGQEKETYDFITALLDAWQGEALNGHQPVFVQRLQRMIGVGDFSGDGTL